MAQSTTALSANGSADYSILRTETDLGREQLECLELLLDDYSKAALRHGGIRNGLKCLEIGAGTGSIARWMANRVRPDGQVLAIDIEPGHVVSRPGLEVRRLDLNEGLPPGETFDLIHARLVLMHLRRRKEIIFDLISSLNPGGQLVLGEYLGPICDPISVPEPGDEELFRKMMSTLIEKVGVPGGISYTWAREMSEILAASGLIDIQTERHMETTTGGTTGSVLLSNYVRQATPLLLENGIDASEIGRFTEMMLDPRFCTWLFEFNSVRATLPNPD